MKACLEVVMLFLLLIEGTTAHHPPWICYGDFDKCGPEPLRDVILSKGDLGSALGLPSTVKIQPLVRADFSRSNGCVSGRYQVIWRGVPVHGSEVIVSKNQKGQFRLYGGLPEGMIRMLGKAPSSLSARGPHDHGSVIGEAIAVQVARRQYFRRFRKWQGKRLTIWRQEVKQIFYDGPGMHSPLLAYLVSFMVMAQGHRPSKPTAVIQASNGKIWHAYDALTSAVDTTSATGPGGNVITGRYQFDTQGLGELEVTVDDNDTWRMQNNHVATYDVAGGAEIVDGQSPFQWQGGATNSERAMNGAHSPLNDAHFFGTQFSKMFTDWFELPIYGVAPAPIAVRLGVHFGLDVPTAFYDINGTVYFGDGGAQYLPFTTPDIVAHEMCHAFTDQPHASRLSYFGQAGAISESFADMCSAVFQMYRLGKATFRIGENVVAGGIRAMNAPSMDGVSIDHVNNYTASMNVHYSSGVFNKAFYHLATTNGWTPRRAFSLFLHANVAYWTPSVTFVKAAEGVVRASEDLRTPVADVRRAFEQVGIILDSATATRVGPTAISASTPASSLPSASKAVPHKIRIENQSSDVDGWQYWVIETVESEKTPARVLLQGGGDADLYLSHDDLPRLTRFDYRPYLSGSNEAITFVSTGGKDDVWYVGVHNPSGAAPLQLVVSGSAISKVRAIDKDGISVVYNSAKGDDGKMFWGSDLFLELHDFDGRKSEPHSKWHAH